MSIVTYFNKCRNQSTHWGPFIYTREQSHISKLNPKFEKFIEISSIKCLKMRYSNVGVYSNTFLRIRLVIFHISFDLIKIRIFSIDSLFVFGTSEMGRNLRKSQQILAIQSLLLSQYFGAFECLFPVESLDQNDGLEKSGVSNMQLFP